MKLHGVWGTYTEEQFQTEFRVVLLLASSQIFESCSSWAYMLTMQQEQTVNQFSCKSRWVLSSHPCEGSKTTLTQWLSFTSSFFYKARRRAQRGHNSVNCCQILWAKPQKHVSTCCFETFYEMYPEVRPQLNCISKALFWKAENTGC